MLRFIALVWDAENEATAAAARLVAQRAESAAEWHSIPVCDGLWVLHRNVGVESDEVQALPHSGGVLFGRIFRKAPEEREPPKSVELGPAEATAIIRSGGRDLVERYWGRYVAFLRKHARRTTWVLRDPSGHLPCFATTYQGVTIYFSHSQDCTALGLITFSIDWQFIAAYLCNWRLQSRRTGLNEVSEVRPGECIEHRGDRTNVVAYWEPTQIARAEPIENFEAAAHLLRNTTRQCVWAWASCYPRIIHSLSGGLDSSIVLSCLRSAPSQPTVTCVHYFEESVADADERRFARLAAERFGCELLERKLNAADVRLEPILSLPRSARPGVYQYSLQHGGFENRMALEKDAAAVFKGIGGDQVFLEGNGDLAVADCLYQGAVRQGWQLAGHVARAERTSIWAVFASGLLQGLIRRQWDARAQLGRYQQLVKPEIVAAVRSDASWLHAWIAEDEDSPPGKLHHIESMAVPFDYYDPLDRLQHAQRVHPLLSQPVMEICIRMPTYLMAQGGRDRAVARRAFENELPRTIVARRAKGGFDSYIRELHDRNRSFLQSVMMDGLLVKQGLLDRRKLEAVFAAPRTTSHRELAELFVYHLSTEAWLRSWSTP